MKYPSFHHALVSLVLAAQVLAPQSFGTLTSFAALESGDLGQSTSSTANPSGQAPTGVLFVKGHVSVNGNIVKTGFTIFSNSLISTNSGSRALVDFGPLGRIEIRSNSAVVLDLTQVSIDLKSKCGRTKIIVTRGQVRVKSPSTESIPAGKDRTYTGPTEVVTEGTTDLIVDCTGEVGPFVKPGILGVLALIGVGSAIGIGTAVGGGDEGAAPASPVR